MMLMSEVVLCNSGFVLEEDVSSCAYNKKAGALDAASSAAGGCIARRRSEEARPALVPGLVFSLSHYSRSAFFRVRRFSD